MTASKYPSVVERYYKKFYFKSSLFKWMNPNEDLCILSHSNRICLVTLAPGHKALSEGPIKRVDFNVNGIDFVNDNKAHGKKKLQALQLKPHTPICEVISGNGNKYLIKSGIFGKLMEVNENLLHDPTLINNMSGTNGFIAVLLHKFCPNDEICKNLLTPEQYVNSNFLIQSDIERFEVTREKDHSVNEANCLVNEGVADTVENDLT